MRAQAPVFWWIGAWHVSFQNSDCLPMFTPARRHRIRPALTGALPWGSDHSDYVSSVTVKQVERKLLKLGIERSDEIPVRFFSV